MAGLLRYAGYFWLFLVLARFAGRLQGAAAVVGFWSALFRMFDQPIEWLAVALAVAPGVALLLIGRWLRSRARHS